MEKWFSLSQEDLLAIGLTATGIYVALVLMT